MIPVLFVVSVVVFLLVHLVPGDPAAAMLGDMATEADIAALRERMGLNRPLLEQYVVWVGNVLHGDFGESVSGNETVLSMILSHLQPTVFLSLYSLIIAAVIAIPLGMIAARKKGDCRPLRYGDFSGRNFPSKFPSGTVSHAAVCRKA